MKILTAIIIFFVISNFANAQQTVDNSKLEAGITKLDLAHAKAIFESDPVALNKLMHDDVTVNHPTNQIVREKSELLNLIKKGVIRYSAFERTPETFLFYPNMVIVMGSEIVTPAAGAPNADKKLHRRYTNIWIKENGIWQLNARHANNVCE